MRYTYVRAATALLATRTPQPSVGQKRMTLLHKRLRANDLSLVSFVRLFGLLRCTQKMRLRAKRAKLHMSDHPK